MAKPIPVAQISNIVAWATEPAKTVDTNIIAIPICITGRSPQRAVAAPAGKSPNIFPSPLAAKTLAAIASP